MTKVLICTFHSKDNKVRGEVWEDVNGFPLPFTLRFHPRPDGENHPFKMEEKFANMKVIEWFINKRAGKDVIIDYKKRKAS